MIDDEDDGDFVDIFFFNMFFDLVYLVVVGLVEVES